MSDQKLESLPDLTEDKVPDLEPCCGETCSVEVNISTLASPSAPASAPTPASELTAEQLEEKKKRDRRDKLTAKLNEERAIASSFSLITSFVSNLWDHFKLKTKVTPLALYKRLVVDHIKASDRGFMLKTIEGFKTFCIQNAEALKKENLFLVPKGAKIYYSETIYIEIQKFIYKSRDDPDTLSSILQYLKCIDASVNPTKEKFDNLEKDLDSFVDTTSDEGKFVSNMLAKTKQTVSSADTSNPISAITSLLQSGILTDLYTGISGGNEKQLNPKKLFSSLQGALGALTGGNEKDIEKLFSNFGGMDMPKGGK